MWIAEKKNGKGTRYMYRERFQDERTGKSISVSVTLNSNSRHAQKMAAEMLRDKFQKKVGNQKEEKAARIESLPLATVCNEWLETTDMAVKDITRRNHRQYIRKLLSEVSPGILFTEFTPAVAEKSINSMYYLDKLSFNYCKSTMVIMKAVMKYAKKAGYIQDISDFESIRLKQRPATHEELEKRTNKFLDHDELEECLSQLSRINYRISLAMEFISLTGLRGGELLALRREDIDMDKKQIRVTGTLVNVRKNGDELQRGTPKNIYSYRTVSIGTKAVQILEWFITDNKRREQWGRRGNSLCSKYKDRGYIFTTETGMPYNLQYINKQLRKVNIPGKHITTHVFRHTYISMLAADEVPLKAIMQQVGHNDPKTTLAIYTHVTESMEKQLQDSLEKMSI